MEYQRGHNFPGLFISFEAGEGAGKGTHQKLLIDYLKQKNYLISSGREPGSTYTGEDIRRILQDPNKPKLNPKAELLLYVTAGIPFFDQEVAPVLRNGGIFIADRWRDSTSAYQGYGRGLNQDFIDSLIRFSCEGAYPDLTFLIDIDPTTGLNRISGNEFDGSKKDRMELETLEFHKRVNQGYRSLAEKNPKRFRVITYLDGSINEMQQQIRNYVDDYIQKMGLEKTLKTNS